jgi:hypothetical protein
MKNTNTMGCNARKTNKKLIVELGLHTGRICKDEAALKA